MQTTMAACAFVGCNEANSYGWLVSIDCEDCGRVYPVAQAKDADCCSDISEKEETF